MKEIHPPRLAQKLFDWFCSDAFVEDMRGDMDELFYVNIERMPVLKAKLKYWIHAFSLMTSYALKKRKPSYQYYTSNGNSIDMLKSYFVIATRSLSKHKFFTIINVLGLAIGMSLSLLFIAMMTNILTYDNFHANGDKIYRITTTINQSNSSDFEFGNSPDYAISPVPLADKLQNDFAGIEEVVRISPALTGNVDYNNNKLPFEGLFVDPGFLRVFTFPLIKGNASALHKPNGLLITEKAAERIFGSEDPIGKVVTLDVFGEYEIAGIMKNPPKNSHIQFELLVSYVAFDMFKQRTQTQSKKPWTEIERSYTYLKVPSSADTGNTLTNLQTFLDRVAKEVYAKEPDFKATFKFIAMGDIASGPGLRRSFGPIWDLASMSIFGVLTLLILLPACFNYSTISISRALKRSKEIGLRKVVGGQRQQIFVQFILETVIVVLLALAISYFLFSMARDEFSSMLVASEFLDLNPTATTFLYFLVFAILLGFVAGVIPALYFSKLNPIEALKSKSSLKGSAGSLLRKSLVVIQFSLSLGFIMSVAITAKQQIATLNYNFGFTQENILDVNLQGVDPNRFRNEFSKLSSVQMVSMSSNVMGASMPMISWIQKPDSEDSVEVFQMSVDHNYLSNLGLTLIAGKSFDEQTDVRSVIVNEEFLRHVKITNPADALNKTFLFPEAGELRVIGVVKDFHFMSLRESIASFAFRYDPKQLHYANLKVVSTNMSKTIGDMEATWKVIAGEKKFEARFFEDEIEEAYNTYYSMIKICGALGLLAISISCLGLLGMVVYATETRTKEIGVRKVMGASTATIAILLSKDYVKLMLIAIVIATPLTIAFFDLLLFGSDHYPIGIGVVEIVVSILLMLLLGVSTILSQTVKAAKANPVETLRYE